MESYNSPNRKTPCGYRQILQIAWPLFFLSASTVVMQFCDRKFLGNSSTEEIAAALPAGSLLATLGTFFISMLSYSNPLTAQFFGAKQKEKCVDVLWSSFRAALLCSAGMLFLLPALGIICLRLTLNGLTYDYAFRYFMVQTPGQLALCLAAPFFAFYAGRGKTAVVSAVNIGAALLNILLDWVLIFGHGGFPKLGIMGAGIATAASQVIAALTIAGIVLFANEQTQYPTRQLYRFDRELFRKIFFIGGPSGFQRLNNSLKFTTIILLVGTLGQMALATTTISLSITMVSFMPLIALTESNLILSGQYLGQNDCEAAKSTTFHTWHLALGYTFLAFIGYIFFSAPVIAMFAPDQPSLELPFETVAHHAWIVLIIMGFWMLTDTVRYVFGSLLRASGDTKALLRISLIVSWGIGIPGFAILTQWLKPPIYFVWLFFIVVSAAEAMLIYRRFRQGIWRMLKLTGDRRKKI